MKSINFVALAACDPQGIIGKEGRLPWHYPEELAHFRASTIGHVMLMGYTTYVSMPERAFQGRVAIVFTRSRRVRKCENIFQVSGLEDLMQLYETNPQFLEKIQWVIGGAEIFDLFFKKGLVQTAIMTYIKKFYEGDTFFPLHHLEHWPKEAIRETADFYIVRHGL